MIDYMANDRACYGEKFIYGTYFSAMVPGRDIKRRKF
jgi:hypothetical protein